MKFKDWLIKEDPDGLHNDSELSWHDSDAVCFLLFKNFYVYSFNSFKKNTHSILIHAYVESVFNQNNKIIKDRGIMLIGSPTQSDKEFLAQFKDKKIEEIKREKILSYDPNIIIGRMWFNDYLLSFWNLNLNVLNRINSIFKLIKILGKNPKDMYYEIENNTYSFNDIMWKKTFKRNVSFDQSKMHTSIQDANIKKVLGLRPKNPIPIHIKQKSYLENFKE